MISVILPYGGQSDLDALLRPFVDSDRIEKLFLLYSGPFLAVPKKCEIVKAQSAQSGNILHGILKKIRTRYALVVTGTSAVRLDPGAAARFIEVAESTRAGILYSDFRELLPPAAGAAETAFRERRLIDYQFGSIRDDFDFGPVLFLSTHAAQSSADKYGSVRDWKTAALYDVRLKIAADFPVVRIPEILYTSVPAEAGRPSREGASAPEISESHFQYVDPASAAFQREREHIAAAHLKNIGAWLPPKFKEVPDPGTAFPVTASVVIPVRNRKATIADAVTSALSQETDFRFNVIVVDNFSTDGTDAVLADLAARDDRLHRLTPAETGLQIGGCWNEAVRSACCGRYAVQLDSDDLYASQGVLQKIVRAFAEENCGMVVGSYTIVDFALKELPPGLIEHREWTKSNGHNNLLRVNGLGAPRAYQTALLREFPFPNVGYGEDYAAGLRISREYRVARIFENLYLCRRWSGNTDHRLSDEQRNANDAYKDFLRTVEIQARRQMKGRKLPPAPVAG
jgi:hypothetical protein